MKLILDQKFNSLPTEKLVVCEGYSDARFIEELLNHNRVTNCRIGCPSDATNQGAGIDAIPSYLRAVQGCIQAGLGRLSGILLIVDADNDPQRCFDKISKAIVNAGFTAPSRPFAVEGIDFKTAVFMIPGERRTGTLEHLLLEAATIKNPDLESCIDNFLDCTGNHKAQTNGNNVAKMKMSALIAASCYDNPWTTLTWMWKSRNNPVPIDSPSFKPLADFLIQFADG